MAGWRRKATGIAVLLALLLAAGAAIIHAMFDSDHIKAMARERAQAAWSRELTIKTLSLHLFPVPALRATGLALSNPAWAHDAQLAEADVVEVRLSWRALLSGRIASGALRIEGGRLSLERGADGKRNWELTGAGERHGALDWRQLVHIEAVDLALAYRHGAATPRTWRVPTLTASASPGWRDLRFHAVVQHAQQTMTAEGRLADLSQLGVEGASTEGRIAAAWPSAHAVLEGRLPLSMSGSALASRFALEAQSAAGLLRFLGVKSGTEATAPLSLQASLNEAHGRLLANGLRLRLGQTEATGELSARRKDGRLLIEGRLDSPAVDWAILSRDAGRPPPDVPKGELFPRNPLAWNVVDALDGVDSMLSLRLGRLKLRSGIQLTSVQAQLRSHDNKVDLPAFSMKLLGGSASGGLRLDGGKRSAQLKLDASGVLLERWFSERGRKVPVSGGPMQISANVQGHGGSLRDIAATLGGTITARGGATLVRSAKAGEAESLLTNLFPLFTESGSQQMKLQCFAGRLPFTNGRADGALVGARSDASQLLTSGQVNLKSQSVDLRGRVRARSGVSLGIAMLSGDVSITGPLKKPGMALDPAGAPGALARLGAAVVTGGLSILATTAWEAVNPGANPCEAALHGRSGK